jgi:hypothetical protein
MQEETDKFDDLCWRNGLQPDFANIDEYFPTAEMHFEGGATLSLPPFRYLFQLRLRNGESAYCLAVYNNGRNGNLLGGVVTRNVLVQVRTT